jgi:hypothetical protein
MTETVGAVQTPDDTLVIAFPGGATFSPPVAFYLACARTAFAELGVRRVLLAFADRAAPCVTAVEMALRARAIPVSCTCVGEASWPDAAHLVASGQVQPSPRLRTLFSFRDLDLLHAIGRTGAVKLFIGLDTAPGYPLAGAWDASPGHHAAMLAYAESAIIISEVTAPPPAEWVGMARDAALQAAFAAVPEALLPPPWNAEDVGQTEVLLMGRDGAALLADAFSTHFSDAPGRATVRQILAALLDPDLPFPAIDAPDPRAALWLGVIASSRAQRLGGPVRSVLELGIDHDFMASSNPPQGWTIWQWFAVLALRQIQPSQTVAAVVSTRNEGINLLEWVAHYQAIGVERIFVYTNGNDDGSDALLTALAAHDIITLVIQHCGPGIWAQRRALQHALLMLPELRQFAWALFPDADEYTVPDARYDHRIAPLLAAANALASQPGAVLLPWRMRLWPHQRDRPPGATLANYTHAVVHNLFKSAVRPAVATSMIEIHFPNLDPGVTLVDSGLAEVPADACWSNEPKSDAGGRIEHVWARSFTDFVIKRQRGIGDGGFRDFDLFHTFNLAMTPENLWPVEPVVIARTQDKLAALRAIPDIAAAADQIEAIYAARAAEIAADPELQAIFAAQPNPNGVEAG